MSTIPALDLRPRDAECRELPANLDAEQALLGCTLYDNQAVETVADVEPHHFFEPFHGRLWEAIGAAIAKGRLAEPISLDEHFRQDPAYQSLGGLGYLADLVDRAPPAVNAPDYGRVITETFMRRELVRLGGEMIKEAGRSDQFSPLPDLIERAERDLLALQLSGSQGAVRLVSASEAAQGVLDYLDSPEADSAGILTGIAPLDEHLGSLLAGDLVLIPGRPGMGKSALGATIALNVARSGVGVIEINSEMTVAQMMRRHLTDIAFDTHGYKAPTYKDIRRRRVSAQQYAMLVEAQQLVGGLPLMMVKRTGLTLSAMRSLIRRQVAAWSREGIRLGLVTVDHVGLLAPDQPGKDRYSDQTGIAIGLKQMADDLGVPVIALVQLSRKVEDRDNKRPQLADMRDSGAWEENADIVIAAFREAYYANKEPEPKEGTTAASLLKWEDWDRRKKSKTIDAILLKVREGEEGIVPLWASIGHNAIRGAEPHDGGFL